MWGFFKRNCLGVQKFLPPTQSLLGFAVRNCGDLSSQPWNHGLVIWLGLGLLAPEISLPNSYAHQYGTSPFCICTPPISLDGCGFFNSIVVRLLLCPISDVPESWWLYILVIILMWLCKEVSHVCLSCHLDWKSGTGSLSLFSS